VNGLAMSAEGEPQTPPPVEKAIKADPVATRMHEISGAMLEYYALNGRLPPKLQDLGPPADSFVYVPAGLQSPDDTRQIVLYDDKPTNPAQRWVILMQRPKARQPAATWVVLLPEIVFKTYAPAR
jgi:hypothetical protein